MREVAGAASVTERTVRRWNCQDTFRDLIAAEGMAMLEAQRTGMRMLPTKSRRTLDAALDDPELDASGARRASLAVRVLAVPHLASYGLGDGGPYP